MGKKIDMTGWKMWEHGVPDSRWEVIEEDKNNKSQSVYWLCKCKCGTIKSVLGSNLRNGISKSCGCKPTKIQIDMTGWRMAEHGIPDSRITVLDLDIEKSFKKNYWRCLCDCGKIFSTEGKYLRKGNVKSCGCLTKKILLERNTSHLKNKIVGYKNENVLVIEDLGLRKQESRNKQERWVKCKCLLCNNIFETRWNNVQTGNTKSCGCLSSYGEKVITDILNKNNIKFKKQYSFDNLIGERGNKLRFDFGILDKNNNLIKLIEFDGRQHFTGPEGGWTHTNSLEKIKELDERKNQYCIDNNILLQRIPYTELNNITIQLLLKGIEEYYV